MVQHNERWPSEAVSDLAMTIEVQCVNRPSDDFKEPNGTMDRPRVSPEEMPGSAIAPRGRSDHESRNINQDRTKDPKRRREPHDRS